MTEKIVYVIFIIVLLYMDVILSKKLKQNYFSEIARSSYIATYRFPVAILYPKPFFKENNFWIGYFLYLFSWLLMGIIVYFFLKLIGAL